MAAAAAQRTRAAAADADADSTGMRSPAPLPHSHTSHAATAAGSNLAPHKRKEHPLDAKEAQQPTLVAEPDEAAAASASASPQPASEAAPVRRTSSSRAPWVGTASLANEHAPAGWHLPTAAALGKDDFTACVPVSAEPPHKQAKHHEHTSAEEEARARTQQLVNRWMLLAAYGALKNIHLSRAQDRHLKLPLKAPAYTLKALLVALGAQVDYQDEAGYSPVHWLVFDGLERARGEMHMTRDAEGELVIDVSELVCWSGLSQRLEMLLRHSEGEGYTYTQRDEDTLAAPPEVEALSTDDEASRAPTPQIEAKGITLMDIRDKRGNTPLHWAVAWRRVDLVGMLLSHGASVDIPNEDGQTVYDMVTWDQQQPQQSAAAASSSVGPEVAVDHSVYCSTGRVSERRWGTVDGLRADQCSYELGGEVEGDAAAIKRLIFQEKLFRAADADPYGDEAAVRRLVDEWHEAEKSGHRMWPLAYRFDVAWADPLSTAVAYEEPNDNIMQLLLSLPHSLHIQSRAHQRSALHEAAALGQYQSDRAGVAPYLQQLLNAGWQVNHRDIATGHTPLATVCDLKATDEDEPDAFGVLMLHTAQFLTERGADPRIVTDEGANSALTLTVFMATNPLLLSHLLDVLKDDQEWLDSHTNEYGNSSMHYALYQAFDTDQHIAQLKLLLERKLSVHHPKNKAGKTPLECWAGYRSKRAAECAQLMGVEMAQVRQVIEPPITRKRLNKLTVIEANVTPGESDVTPVLSEYELEVGPGAHPVVWPSFTYLREHRTLNEGDFTSEFVAHSLAPERDQLQQVLWHVEPIIQEPIPLSFLSVRETARKGLGLFATRAIPQRAANGAEWGIEVLGELVSESAGVERERQHQLQHHVGYCIHRVVDEFGNVMLIDMFSCGSLARFINHSDQPNAQAWRVSSSRRCIVFPTRRIAKDEEITIDYSE